MFFHESRRKRFRKKTLSAAIIAGLSLTGLQMSTRPIIAQEQAKSVGIIEGKIVNSVTQQPIVGARISVVGTKLGAISNADGKFVVRNVPAGIYRVQAVSLGFESFVQTDVIVSSGKPYTITIPLQERVVELEGVEVQDSYFRKGIESITSTQLLNAEDTRRAPGGQEDVIRAVSLLPGVAVTPNFRNDLVVRGGAPFENLFLVDNIEIPNINHFGSQGATGGPLSLINIDFVRETSFSAGGFGVQYGDKTSSVTNINLRDGNSERLTGELNLSATGFGAIVEGPIGERGTFMASVRRSYLDLIFKAAGFGFVPEYWDFTLKTSYKLDAKNSLSFLTIGALDNIRLFNETEKQRFDNSRIVAPNQDQYFSGLTWMHQFGQGYVKTTLGRTWSRFISGQKDTTLSPIFGNTSTEGENSLRVDGVLQLSKDLELSFGNIAKYASSLKYDLWLLGSLRRDANGVARELNVDTSFTAFRNGTYVQAAYYLTDRLRGTLGLRADYYAFLEDKFKVAPRLGLSYMLTDKSTLNFSAGRFYQAPSYIWLVGDQANPQNLKPFSTDQIVFGLEHILKSDLKFQIETYYKSYQNYPTRVFRPQAVFSPAGFDDVNNDIPFGLEPLTSLGTGQAYGVEMFLQKKMAEIPCYGLISVSINKTEFTAIDGNTRASSFDSRLGLTALGGYRFNDEWEISGKFRLGTGLPTTPIITDKDSPNYGRQDFTRFNEGERLPIFHQLDVRVDKRWNFSGIQLVTYIDIQNLYSRKNVSAVRWNAQKQIVEKNESIGLLPSIGVNVEF